MNRITAYCYSKFDKFNGSKIAILIRNGTDTYYTKDVESKSQEYIELEAIREVLESVPDNCGLEMFIHPGKSFKKIVFNSSKLDKSLKQLMSNKGLFIYWLREGERNKKVEELKKLVN